MHEASRGGLLVRMATVELTHGALEHAAVSRGDLARNGEAVLPAVPDGQVDVLLGVGHPHPADENATTVVGLERLRGIEVEACVPERERRETALAMDVAAKHEVAGLVDVATFPLGTGEALRGDREHLDLGRMRAIPVIDELEVVGALPHVAEGILGGHAVPEGPLLEVDRREDEHLSPVVLPARALDHEVLVARSPHLGVADVLGVVLRVVVVRHDDLLGTKGEAVLAHDVDGVRLATALDVVVSVLVLALDVAGVEDVHHPELHESAAGVHAGDVEGLVGIEGRALVGPVHEVVAQGVAPHLDAALGIEGRVLEVGVIGVAQLAEAIGVIEPSDGRHEVEVLLEPAGGGGALGHLAKGVQIAGKGVTHGGLPGFSSVIASRKMIQTRGAVGIPKRSGVIIGSPLDGVGR